MSDKIEQKDKEIEEVKQDNYAKEIEKVLSILFIATVFTGILVLFWRYLDRQKLKNRMALNQLSKSEKEKEKLEKKSKKEVKKIEKKLEKKDARLEREIVDKRKVTKELEKKEEENAKLAKMIKEKEPIFVKLSNDRKIKFDSICWITSNHEERERGKKIYLSDGKTIIENVNLTDLEKKYPFKRTHRQHLINIDFIETFSKNGVTLRGISELVKFPDNGSKYYDEIKEILEKRDFFEDKL